MKLPLWLRNPIARRTKSRKRSNARRPRLFLEALEDRVLLSILEQWLGGSGDWHDSSRWLAHEQPDNFHRAPGPDDVIDLTGLSADDTITYSSAAAESVQALSLSRGTLVLQNGSLTLTGGGG